MDAKPFIKDLNLFAQRQVPFMASLAVNLIAKDVRDAADASIAGHFRVRRPWITSAFVVTPSDKKQDVISATVELKRNHKLLEKFEEGTPKVSTDPSLPIAIPTSALRGNADGLAPLSMYPKNLRLVPRMSPNGPLAPTGRVMRSGMVQLKGKRRTFVIDPATMPSASKWGVWQRFGPGRHDIRRIWTFAKRIPIPRRLHFYETAAKTIAQKAAGRFTEAFERAMRTAR